MSLGFLFILQRGGWPSRCVRDLMTQGLKNFDPGKSEAREPRLELLRMWQIPQLFSDTWVINRDKPPWNNNSYFTKESKSERHPLFLSECLLQETFHCCCHQTNAPYKQTNQRKETAYEITTCSVTEPSPRIHKPRDDRLSGFSLREGEHNSTSL